MASVDWQPVRRRVRWRPVAAVGLLAWAASLLAIGPAGFKPIHSSERSDVETAAFFEPPSVPALAEAEPLILAPRPQQAGGTEAGRPRDEAAPPAALPVAGGIGADATSNLLPPQPMPAQGSFTEWSGLAGEYDISPEAAAEAVQPPTRNAPTNSEAVTGRRKPDTSTDQASRESKQQIANTSPGESLQLDTMPVATGAPTSAIVDERAQELIRRAFALAQRGATFAARHEFVDVLRFIAEAKDEQERSTQHTTALANGLQALEEVNDFAPRLARSESNLSLSAILASHRTPVAKEDGLKKLTPQQLSERYFRYAQRKLAESVASEPAGSMALHALGKLSSQLGRVEADKQPFAERKAFALQQAALLARDDNHLAAHELGVLLAESGHYAEAEYLLNQVAVREPNPVVFRNLARVQQKLGHTQLAELSEQQAQFMASRGVSGNNGVVWVSPGALSQTGDPLAPAATTPTQVAGQVQANSPNTAVAAPAREPMRNVTRLPGGPVMR